MGFHHQPDLSPFLQELSGCRAKAKPSLDLKRRFFFVSRAVPHERRQGRFFCDNHKRPRPVPGRCRGLRVQADRRSAAGGRREATAVSRPCRPIRGIIGVAELLTCRCAVCLMDVIPGGRRHLDGRGRHQRCADDGEDDLSHGRFPLLHAYREAMAPRVLHRSDIAMEG